jgi:hypothetical protein
VTDIGQVQSRWPTKVAIATKNQDAHEHPFHVRTCDLTLQPTLPTYRTQNL